jgi:hypothetical protein
VALRRQKSVREHIEPTAVGGADAEENLAYACSGCNSSKAVAQVSIDTETGQLVPLFHPRLDVWANHFIWSDDTLTLIGITPTGCATIDRLRLNRVGVVNLRGLLKDKGLHP